MKRFTVALAACVLVSACSDSRPGLPLAPEAKLEDPAAAQLHPLPSLAPPTGEDVAAAERLEFLTFGPDVEATGPLLAGVNGGMRVLLLADAACDGTTALVNALTAAGHTVTVGPIPEYNWNGTNPPLSTYNVVVHLNGSSYTSSIPSGAQTALLSFVQSGGGYVHGQWHGYEWKYGQLEAMSDLVLLSYPSYPGPSNCVDCTVTYNRVWGQSGHPVLTGIPSSFSFRADAHSDLARSWQANPPTVLMTTHTGGPGVLVRQVGLGRVVMFSVGPSYQFWHYSSTLLNPTIRQLYLNAVSWSGDQTPPVITPVVTGTLSPNGWYTSYVTVSWNVTDAESAIRSTTGCSPATVTEDTTGRTFTCTAASFGGTSSASVTIKRDASGPVVTPSVAGTLGADGWYVSDVSVAWSVTDQSPILSQNGCDAVTISENTAGRTLTCTAASEGGTTTASVTVKRDVTSPAVTPVVAGTPGEGGWYVSDVGVSWSVAAGPSGATLGDGCASAVLVEDTPGRTFTCTGTSGAGLSSTASVTVKRDATPPSVAASLAGTLGSEGWYVSDVAVAWNVTAGLSGLAGPADGCAPAAVSEDTPGRTFTCTATSGAGLSSTESVTVKRDTTVPTVTPSVSGLLGHEGWYVSDVSVTWAVAGGVSGVAAGEGCAAATLTEDTPGKTFSCTATSGAGLAAAASVTVKRDATPPSVAFSGNKGAYQVDEVVSITCSAADALSGLGSSTCENVERAAYLFPVGSTTLSASATDVAGNNAVASTTFTVAVTTQSLCSVVTSLVSDRGMVNSLCAKLDAAAKAKNAQARGGQIQAFINEVMAQAGKKIPRDIAMLLVALADAL